MRRYRLVAGGAAVLLVTAFAAVRVFAPADTLDRSRTPFPPPAAAQNRVYGELMDAPLVVDGRMRVYAARNRVWADGPVDMAAPASALWAFRRWPAQLVGVVADDHLVVSKWSDGELVAIDPDAGRISWRADGGVDTTMYAGRRTGASTVYEPPGLYLAPGTVVSARAGGALTGFDSATGKVLWRKEFNDRPDCRTMFTTPGALVVADRCTQPSTVDLYAAATGDRIARLPVGPAVRPVGCRVGRQGCTGLVGAAGGWLFGRDGSATRAPALTGGDSWLAGNLVVHLDGGQLLAHDAVTGEPAWKWPGSRALPDGTRIVAAEPTLVHVVTPNDMLYNIETANGLERSGYAAHVAMVPKPWVPGHVYAADGYVAIERLLPGGRPDGKDSEYYYPFPTVLLTGS
jgi:outer membrane protein assembly factor BamB